MKYVFHSLAKNKSVAKRARALGYGLLASGSNSFFYDMERNGEKWLIQQTAPSLKNKVIVDIGANKGNWTANAMKCCPESRFVAVEMIPVFADGLRERFGSKVDIIETAISNSAEDLTAYKFGGAADLSTARLKKAELFEVEARTGDDILSQYDNIGLIKVDVDGYDVPALYSLAETIKRNSPVIQFEYSRFYIETRHFLKDAYDFLDSLGYRTGMLLQNRVEFTKWSRYMETFMTSNHVSVPKNFTLL